MASSTSPTFPKWQIALALGATGVIGLSYLLLRNSASDSSSKQKRGQFGRKGQSLSLDGDGGDLPAKDETPQQKSQRLKNEGNVAFRKGRYDDAIRLYTDAIEVCPIEMKTDLSTFYQNRAAAHEQQRNWDKVIEDCSAALEFNVKYEKALYRRAKAFEIQKNWDLCLDDINAVCLLQGFNNQNALFMADRVLKEIGKVRAAERMKTRSLRFPSKHFVKTYFTSFSEDPVYKKLMDTSIPVGEGEVKGFLRAKLAFAQENYEQVVQACTEEIDSSEAESRYLFEALSLRAAFNILRGAHKEAMDDLATICGSEECDRFIRVNVLIKRASLHMQTGDLEKCLADFETAAQLGPDVSDVFHHRGQIRLLMEKSEEACADFERAVELNPNFAIAVVQNCFAQYRRALGEKDVTKLMQCMEEFRKSTETFSDCSEAFILFAQVLAETREFEQANALYEKAQKVDPTNGTLLVHKALLKISWNSKFDEGIQLMREAIRIDPQCEFAYETLGTIEVQQGNLLIAVELFDKAIDMARTEIEMTHLFSLRCAAESQQRVSTRLGITPQKIPI